LLVARGPPRHLNGLGAGSRHCLRALIFADTGKGAAFRRSGNHVAVQHKAQPAERGGGRRGQFTWRDEGELVDY